MEEKPVRRRLRLPVAGAPTIAIDFVPPMFFFGGIFNPGENDRL
jgi:hypothetical protein